MSDLITRQFRVMRGNQEIVYPFTTRSSIFIEKGRSALPLRLTLPLQLFNFLKYVFMAEADPAELKESVSQMKRLITPEFKHTKDHDVIRIAKEASYEGKGDNQHDYVQQFFLKNDPYTVATEIPVWNETESGHIDLMRLNGDQIEIWDFKPNAHQEKKACSQVWRYRDIFCQQSGIKHKQVNIGYFDNLNCYFLNSQYL